MKVLLISANRVVAPYPVYPIGLDYVASSISDKHEVKIADINHLKKCELLGEMINDFVPNVIGVSLRNIDNTDTVDAKGFIENYRELIDAVRDYSDAPIVLGGSGFTIFPEEVMKALGADYGVIGEGERLGLLLDAIENNEDAGNIPGVITRGQTEVIPKPWDSNFNRDFNGKNDHIEFYLRRGGMLNLQSKRGCSFNCIYCTYPHIEGRELRVLAPEDVAETAVRLQEAGAKYFFVTDSAFNCDYNHSIEVAKAFIKAKVSIPWGAFFAPTEPPQGYFDIMAKAGVSHVEFGTESLSNRMLKAYRKPFNVDDVFKAHESANSAGLNVAHYLLLGGPGEDETTLSETLQNADRLDKTVIFFFCGIRIYPYTGLYDIALKEGQVDASKSLLEPVFYQSPLINSDKIIENVKDFAGERSNWIIGSGGDKTAKTVSRMYRRGHTGPLWEFLIK